MRNGLTKRYSLENTNLETPPRTKDLKMTYTNQFYSPEHVTHRRLVRPQFRDDRPEILAAQNRTQNRMTESQALHILQKHHNKIKDDNKNLKHENAKIKEELSSKEKEWEFKTKQLEEKQKRNCIWTFIAIAFISLALLIILNVMSQAINASARFNRGGYT